MQTGFLQLLLSLWSALLIDTQALRATKFSGGGKSLL
jgi:hypothetical protein